jgi:hypothetical protein
MAFNAHWTLEDLARERNSPLIDLLTELLADFSALAETCPIYRLKVQPGGNCFALADRNGADYLPPSQAGLYSIFTQEAVVYFGEATDLCRRILKDPDNTADSGKVFTNQGRAVLKFLLHRGWDQRLSLSPLLIQLYAAKCRLDTKGGLTFEESCQVSRFSKALEGALSVFAPRYHSKMVARAMEDQLLRA